MRDFLNTGEGLPTTANPLVMDIAPQIMAVTQQAIKSRRQEIADNKLEITKNEDMLLKAMDFETVQGLSDKVQTEHMSRLEQFQKDGAELMLERRGMLSNADKLKIVQEKRRIDSEIGSMKANVLAYNKLSEELVKQRNEHRYDSYLDLDKTAANMNKWVEDGNIGKPVLGLLAYRDIQPGEIVEGIYGDQLKEFYKQADEEIALRGKDDPAGTYKILTDYQKKIDGFKQIMESNPALRGKINGANDYLDKVYGGQKLTSKWMPNYGRVARSTTDPELKAEPGNNMLDQAWKQSGNAEDLLVKAGVLKKAKWRFDKNEGWTLDAVKFDGTSGTFPKSMGEQGWKTALNDFLPVSARIKDPNLIKTNLGTLRENAPTPTETMNVFKDHVDHYNKTTTDGSQLMSDLVVSQINDLFPKGWKAEKVGLFKSMKPSEGTRGSIDIIDPDGNKTNFNLKDKAGRDALVKFYEENSLEGKALKDLNNEKATEPQFNPDTEKQGKAPDGRIVIYDKVTNEPLRYAK